MAKTGSVIVCSDISEDGTDGVEIPLSAGTISGFRTWAKSETYPVSGRYAYIGGHILVDLSMEEIETHNKVKSEILAVLHVVVKQHSLGEFYMDGVLVTNTEAEVSNEPEAAFVSWQSFEQGRAHAIPREGFPGQFVEIEGSADWILEVVSNSSVQKDKVLLKDHYARAQITEYWLVDARKREVDFQILHLTSGSYVPAPSRDGWQWSEVFQRWFRLDRHRNQLGRWEYTLAIRTDFATGNGTPS